MSDGRPVSDDIAARLARIEAEDGVLRSFIRVDGAAARASAALADGRRARGMTLGALDGAAVAVKDNLAVAGAPWTGGIGGRRGLLAAEDAAVVSRLKAAGAVVLGGLNMEEGALGAVTDNAVFGRCLNPLGPLQGAVLTPGGSSGGSAAAVAAGFVDLSLGTDTMGSVRIPAAYCGLFGLKPTYGLIPRSGMAYLAPSLDTIGPLARDVALLWPAVLAMAGVDAGDPEARPAPNCWDERQAASLRGVVLGVPGSLEDVEIEAEVNGAGASEKEYILCRCGQSKNKPFCDNSHRDIDFKDAGAVGDKGLAEIESGGPLTIRRIPDGPLEVTGNFSIRAGSGRDAWSGRKAYLCRCGQSANKPFCDGAHTAAGFKAA